MASESYKDKLRDRRWLVKKNKILSRDMFMCQNKSCRFKFDNKVPLNVHHIEYIGGYEPWEYPDDMLITLCEDCHHKEHFERTKMEDNLRVCFRMMGLLQSDLVAMCSMYYYNPEERQKLIDSILKFQNPQNG